MRILKFILSVMIFINFTNPIYATTTLENQNLISNSILEASRLSKSNLSLYSIELIFDIENSQKIAYLKFVEGGYSFVDLENGQLILFVPDSVDYPYQNYDNSYKKIFGGPFSYLVESPSNQLLDAESNSIINPERLNLNIYSIVKNNNAENLLFSNNNKSSNLRSYTGISETRFTRYNNWINHNSTCGTYATAILLAYLDDYVNNKYVPASVRTQNSTSPGTLINVLTPLIDGRTNYTGTYPDDLYMGTRQYFINYGISYVHDFGGSTFSTAKTVINSGRPIVIGLLQALGSSYGNHWVTAYQYEDGSLLNDYYKVIDNHGNYHAIISVGWTYGFYKITG